MGAMPPTQIFWPTQKCRATQIFWPSVARQAAGDGEVGTRLKNRHCVQVPDFQRFAAVPFGPHVNMSGICWPWSRFEQKFGSPRTLFGGSLRAADALLGDANITEASPALHLRALYCFQSSRCTQSGFIGVLIPAASSLQTSLLSIDPVDFCSFSYTGTIYSTRSLQIRGVFEVKVIHFRAGGANSHTCCGESVRIPKTEISEQIGNF